MKPQTLLGRHYQTERAVAVSVQGASILDVREIDTVEPLPWIAPGLFDLQINGSGGTWFGEDQLNVGQVLEILDMLLSHGITRVFPTLITNSREVLEHGFRVIREACERESWADWMVAGCHLEGPYLSAEDGPRGAHAREHVRGCDWDEFQGWQRASGNRIKLVTLAPEANQAIPFIRRAVTSGVTISLGHTAANSRQIAAAVDAGARLSTHLGNGAHALLPRHPNYLWDQLAEPRLMASAIADGYHLSDNFFRTLLLVKGVQNVILTCDASGFAGCLPGPCEYQGSQYEVLEDGRIVVAGQRNYLAGSGVFTDTCISWTMQTTGCSLADAWQMATTNPSRLLGVEVASLQAGSIADLVLFDCDPETSRISIRQTLLRGQSVVTPPPALSETGVIVAAG